MANKFMPIPEEQPDGSFMFKLRDDVVLVLKPHSDTKQEAQMWRKHVLLPPTAGSLVMDSFREKLVKIAKQGFNEPEEKDDKGNVTKAEVINVPNIEEDINLVATVLGIPGADGRSPRDKLQQGEGRSLAEQLIAFAEQKGEFFHDQERTAYASVQRNGHVETYPVESRNFRLWLKGEYKREFREKAEAAALAQQERLAEQMGPLFSDADSATVTIPPAPIIRSQTLADAVAEIEAMAINDGPEHEVHLRVAGHAGNIYIDLCNEEWQAVEVTPNGWSIIEEAPVRFVRSNTMRPLVTPESGGSVEDLRKILTLSEDDPDDKAAWRLILAWLVQALRPEGGQYPVLVLLGGQGSAKTNTARFLRRLVDPSVVKDTSPPKGEHDLYIRGLNSWVISVDNVSTLPHWLSDAICRIATEGGFATRKLYSGREEEVFDALRPFILNGISDVASRPDLLDRSLLVNLPVIKGNKRLRKVKAEFAKKEAGILGALLDAVSAGLAADLDEEEADLNLPRLADFAVWAMATESALGGKPGSFMAAYKKSRGEATETALEAEPIVYPLLKLAKSYTEDEPWCGTTKELLDDLNDKESDDTLRRSKEWPKSPRKLSELLKRLAPPLTEAGVIVEKVAGSRRDGRRMNVFYRDPGRGPGDDRGPGDGGDDTPETVTNTVTIESGVSITDSENGDGGDDGDDTFSHQNESEELLDDEGEV